MLHSFQSRIHDKLLTAVPQLKVGADRRHGKHRNRLGQSGLEYERRRLTSAWRSKKGSQASSRVRATASKVFLGLSDNPCSVAIYTVAAPCSHGVGAASHHHKATFSGLHSSRQTGSHLLSFLFMSVLLPSSPHRDWTRAPSLLQELTLFF